MKNRIERRFHKTSSKNDVIKQTRARWGPANFFQPKLLLHNKYG